MKPLMRYWLPLLLAIGISTTFFSCAKDDSINSAAVGSNPAEVTDRTPGPSANGQGFLTTFYFEGFQTFSFHAKQNADGSVTGSWEIKSLGLGVRAHGSIDCLNILPDGKTAIMSGIITNFDGEYYGVMVGDPAWFKVVDNGEGANSASDLFSDLFVPFGDCSFEWDIYFGIPLQPIVHGNIQVKP